MPNAVGEILEQIGHRDCAGNRCRPFFYRVRISPSLFANARERISFSK